MKVTKKGAKHSLLDMLRNLLLEGIASTQEELCTALNKQGFDVNQSKISRLLRKIDAVKARNESGEVVYRLPVEPAPPTANSELSHLIIEISANEFVIVIRTSPGSASLIARLLDHHRDTAEILGTVAGDDTILVVPHSIRRIKFTIQQIRNLLAGM